MSRRYTVIGSFRFALAGLREVILNEPNFQIHTIAGITASIAAGILEFNKSEWVILLFTIAFVLILELMNTAIENIVDLVSPEIQPQAKVAKDVAASAVLISAILAIIIGIFLFGPKIISLL
jgi:undecaprenol kinase